MKDYHHIDELIRRKFEGFEPAPPESVWDKVRSGIGPGASSSRGGNITLPIITGLIVLVGLLSLLFLISRMEATMPLQAENTAVAFSTSQGAPVQDTHQIAGASFMTVAPNTTFNAEDYSSRILTSSDIPVRKPFEGRPHIFSSETADLEPNHEAQPVNLSRPGRSSRLERFTMDSRHLAGDGLIDNNPSSVAPEVREESLPGIREDYAPRLKPRWSLGLYFNPEVAAYPSDDISNTIHYSLQVLPRITFNRWYLQSGIGLRAGGDRGDYVINYNKYLGSYEDVYEVTFDTTSGGIIPVYHTETVEVYDTVPYYSISETKVTFAYLDVPLLIGRQWEFKRLSLYLHAGPSFSLLLGRSSPEADYPEENIRILNESPQIPARERFNWQIMAGAGMDYSISDRISLSLEPTFRYYLTKDYDKYQLNTRHPYSFGIRAGLIYHINP